MKQWLKSIIPQRWEVPAKYYFNSLMGTLEPELEILSSIVRRFDSAIDIGANRGIYTYRLYKIGAAISAFEPNPRCMNCLKAWSSDKKGLVSLYPVALSDKNGQAELHIPVDNQGVEHDASASLQHADFSKMRSINVQLRTLDSYNFSDVKFIKIDVEGHERSVLLGASATLQRDRPVLLIEIEQRHSSEPISSVFELLYSYGYSGFFLESGHLAPLVSFDLANDQAISNLGRAGARYINNFVFFHQHLLNQGFYQELFKKWTKS